MIPHGAIACWWCAMLCGWCSKACARTLLAQWSPKGLQKGTGVSESDQRTCRIPAASKVPCRTQHPVSATLLLAQLQSAGLPFQNCLYLDHRVHTHRSVRTTNAHEWENVMGELDHTRTSGRAEHPSATVQMQNVECARLWSPATGKEQTVNKRDQVHPALPSQMSNVDTCGGRRGSRCTCSPEVRSDPTAACVRSVTAVSQTWGGEPRLGHTHTDFYACLQLPACSSQQRHRPQPYRTQGQPPRLDLRGVTGAATAVSGAPD